MERWASFDCYGTLIDWNTGIRDELARVFDLEPPPEPEPEPVAEAESEPGSEAQPKRGLFGRKKKAKAAPEPEPAPDEPEEEEGPSEEELARIAKLDELLAKYHELEPQVQKEGGFMSYRNVMTEVMRQLGAPAGTEEGLANSLPSWQPFEEVPGVLAELRERGWKLAILSNSDPDLIAASKELLGVPFDITIVASEIMSYKPALRHWQEFQFVSNTTRENHVHVAASAFHDIAPAAKLRIPNVWINRLGEHAPLTPTRELTDLTDLPDTLDQLIPG